MICNIVFDWQNGYMDLLESNDFLDNSCIFKNENPLREFRSTRDGESGHRVGWGGASGKQISWGLIV